MVPLRYIKPRPIAALAVLAATLTACGGPEQLTVSDAWVRLAAVKDRPAAAYFTLHGGPKAATLISVRGDLAIRTEMHRSMQSGGMASMAPLASVTIPAGADVPFAPGGRHVMLFGVNPAVKPGAAMTLTFTFADGARIPLTTPVIGAGDPAPQ